MELKPKEKSVLIEALGKNVNYKNVAKCISKVCGSTLYNLNPKK